MRLKKCSPIVSIICILAAGLQAGCQEQTFSSSILNPFDFKLPFVPTKDPVRIGIADQGVGLFDPSTWKIGEMGSPWTPLRLRLERHLGVPVQISPLKPFQVAAHLQSGRIQFAFLSARDYVDLAKEFGDLGDVIAVSEVLERQGLIVAESKSEINALADIPGNRFSFGPVNDPVLDEGARNALLAAGVKPEQIKKELLPIPNTFQHHISSAESAYEIAYGIGTNVGVIDKAEYDDYPETGGSFLLRTFSKDSFRILGETEKVRFDTIPEGPFLASDDTDVELVGRVRDFLVSAGEDEQPAFRAMGLAGFVPPAGDVERQLAHLATLESPTPDAILDTPDDPKAIQAEE